MVADHLSLQSQTRRREKKRGRARATDEKRCQMVKKGRKPKNQIALDSDARPARSNVFHVFLLHIGTSEGSTKCFEDGHANCAG